MTTRQFREAIEKQCTVIPRTDMTFEDAHDYWRKRDAMADAINKAQQGEAVQVCSAGEWPETDHGGNWTPDRIAANHSFSDWLDQQGDSIVPTSMSEWLGSEDSIFIE